MRAWAAAAGDAAGIAIFAIVGRASHSEALGPIDTAATAWPFWVGAAAGWLVTRAWRRPAALPTGLGVWAGTLVGGMTLRALTGAGVQLAFVIVAATTLAILLLGWRGILVAARRTKLSRRGTATN